MNQQATVQTPKPVRHTSPEKSGLLQRKCACGQHTSAGGECAECKKKQKLQRSATNQTEPTTVPPIVHEVLRSPGQPLDAATHAYMEPRFGYDFSQVRVHTATPETAQGGLTIGSVNDPFEQEADRVGEAVMRTSGLDASNESTPRAGYDFSQVSVHTDALDSLENLITEQGDQHKHEVNRVMEQNRMAKHIFNGKSDCSPTWFGDTSPEVDPSGGSFTGRVVVKYNDAELKDPCVRECVEVHENVHVRQLTPVVKKIHECDVAAGDDWDKKAKCNDMANRELNEPLQRWECEAYQKSFTCLTLKILDSKSPCSKSPHRKEVQKHRGYEACEMKRHCAEAGTPEAGIPNV